MGTVSRVGHLRQRKRSAGGIMIGQAGISVGVSSVIQASMVSAHRMIIRSLGFLIGTSF